MKRAGELDALVAEKVLSQIVCRTKADIPPGYFLDLGQSLPGYRDGTFVYTLPEHSTNIVAAWTVVGAFDEVDLRKGPYGWLCRLERGNDTVIQMGEAFRAASAPLAICRAALDAVSTS